MPNEPPAFFPPEVIETKRLRLRRPRLSDTASIFEYASDPEVARYADWPICRTIDSVVQTLSRRDEEWTSATEFYWVMALPPEDHAIGALSCCVSRHSAEFGFVLNQRFWRNGYATEASRAIVGWVFSLPFTWRLWATCDVENVASARVLEKSGLSLEGKLRRAVVRPNLSDEPRDALLYSKVRA
jgi:RimJ/RimL family protein N-acetyltransferase